MCRAAVGARTIEVNLTTLMFSLLLGRDIFVKMNVIGKQRTPFEYVRMRTYVPSIICVKTFESGMSLRFSIMCPFDFQ